MDIENLRIVIRPITPTPGIDRGLFNGYVVVPPGHPWHGLQYDYIGGVEVHGGLTYSYWDEDDWMVGFETAHFGDTAAAWPIARVANECHKLMMHAYAVAKEEEIL